MKKNDIIKAIVYTSNTGYTRQYAEVLAQKTGLPAYSLDKAKGNLDSGSHIIYLGWLMAGKIQGYAKAAKLYTIDAVCGVGMGATGSQLQDLIKANNIPDDLPIFTLQGGFDITRLKGIHKMMMNVMIKTAGKGLSEKENRTHDEDVMLDMLLHGGNYVSEENLVDVLAWYEK